MLLHNSLLPLLGFHLNGLLSLSLAFVETEKSWREANRINPWKPPLGHRRLEFHIMPLKFEDKSTVLNISHIFKAYLRSKFSGEGLILFDCRKSIRISIYVNWGLPRLSIGIVKLVEL